MLADVERSRGNAADNSTDQRPRYAVNEALPFASGVILHDHRSLGAPRKIVARCVVTRLGIPPNGLIYKLNLSRLTDLRVMDHGER